METVDISIFALSLAFLLLIVPIVMSFYLGLNMIKPMLYSTARMSIQLFLIGIFLKYLFEYNNPYLNILWFFIMITSAVFTVVKSSSLKAGKVIFPVLISFTAATFCVLFFINFFVIDLDNVFDARYLIVLGGMLLGNSLRGNIVGVGTFYSNIRKDNKRFLYTLSLGATHYEAVIPYLRESLELALKPTIAAMATMGIVALPGMMTGVILGGADPETAIKYQIMIMLAILVSTLLSVLLTILMTLKICFNRYGVLKQDVFTVKK